MNYLQNKDEFFKSDYALQIVDKWVTGVPFYMEHEGKVYDAFLFYSDNRKTGKFNSIKMLILMDVNTGEVKQLSEKVTSYGISEDFDFEIKSFNDIDEYISLLQKIEEVYIKLRNSFIRNLTLDRKLQDQYLDLVIRTIPKAIIEKVYKKLSPTLFIEQ